MKHYHKYEIFSRNICHRADQGISWPEFDLSVILFNHDRRITPCQSHEPEPADSLELIGVVWDTLSPDDLAVTDAERALLDARLADMEAHPDDQSPWPEVKARLERLTR
jgi:putative addiction module component (TIGR02574 family)